MFDANIDQAILHARTDAASLSDCASAVDHRGRREVTAREIRCRHARPVPAANDDEKPIAAVHRGRRFTVDPADPLTVIITEITEGETNGRDDTAS